MEYMEHDVVLGSENQPNEFLAFVQNEFSQTSEWAPSFFAYLGEFIGTTPEVVRSGFIVVSLALALLIFWLIYELRRHSKEHRKTKLRRFWGLDNFHPDKE